MLCIWVYVCVRVCVQYKGGQAEKSASGFLLATNFTQLLLPGRLFRLFLPHAFMVALDVSVVEV